MSSLYKKNALLSLVQTNNSEKTILRAEQQCIDNGTRLTS